MLELDCKLDHRTFDLSRGLFIFVAFQSLSFIRCLSFVLICIFLIQFGYTWTSIYLMGTVQSECFKSFSA